MSKLRKLMKLGPPVHVGDLAINWADWRLEDETEEEFLERTKDNITQYPSDNDYVFALQLQEITKFEKGRFFIKSTQMPFKEKSRTNWCYNKNLIKPFSKDLYNRLMAAYPLRGKVGDKIINPYLIMKDQDISECREDKYHHFYGYGIDALNTKVDLEKHRHFWAKSLPYLEVYNIYSEVWYNIKYKKYLFTIAHYYECSMKNDDVQIIATIEDDDLQHYESFNGIWNSVCMSPNQET